MQENDKSKSNGSNNSIHPAQLAANELSELMKTVGAKGVLAVYDPDEAEITAVIPDPASEDGAEPESSTPHSVPLGTGGLVLVFIMNIDNAEWVNGLEPGIYEADTNAMKSYLEAST